MDLPSSQELTDYIDDAKAEGTRKSEIWAKNNYENWRTSLANKETVPALEDLWEMEKGAVAKILCKWAKTTVGNRGKPWDCDSLNGLVLAFGRVMKEELGWTLEEKEFEKFRTLKNRRVRERRKEQHKRSSKLSIICFA